MPDKNETKEQITLKEDQLDKTVGGDTYITYRSCPQCGEYSLYDNGRMTYCTLCRWQSDAS